MNSQVEKSVLEKVAADLRADGYEVSLNPRSLDLPSFMRGYVPDAVAFGSKKNIAIEVSRRRKKLVEIQKLFEDQSNWELKLVIVSSNERQGALKIQKIEVIEKKISEVLVLVEQGQVETALLLCWATFEAIARFVSSEQFLRAQTPGRIVQLLGHQGYITPQEVELLERLAKVRNRLIHGELNARASSSEVREFVHILRLVLQAAS